MSDSDTTGTGGAEAEAEAEHRNNHDHDYGYDSDSSDASDASVVTAIYSPLNSSPAAPQAPETIAQTSSPSITASAEPESISTPLPKPSIAGRDASSSSSAQQTPPSSLVRSDAPHTSSPIGSTLPEQLNQTRPVSAPRRSFPTPTRSSRPPLPTTIESPLAPTPRAPRSQVTPRHRIREAPVPFPVFTDLIASAFDTSSDGSALPSPSREALRSIGTNAFSRASQLVARAAPTAPDLNPQLRRGRARSNTIHSALNPTLEPVSEEEFQLARVANTLRAEALSTDPAARQFVDEERIRLTAPLNVEPAPRHIIEERRLPTTGTASHLRHRDQSENLRFRARLPDRDTRDFSGIGVNLPQIEQRIQIPHQADSRPLQSGLGFLYHEGSSRFSDQPVTSSPRRENSRDNWRGEDSQRAEAEIQRARRLATEEELRQRPAALYQPGSYRGIVSTRLERPRTFGREDRDRTPRPHDRRPLPNIPSRAPGGELIPDTRPELSSRTQDTTQTLRSPRNSSNDHNTDQRILAVFSVPENPVEVFEQLYSQASTKSTCSSLRRTRSFVDLPSLVKKAARSSPDLRTPTLETGQYNMNYSQYSDASQGGSNSRQAPPSPSQGIPHSNGMNNGMTAGNGLVGLPTPAGHQSDLNYVMSMVEELSGILRVNQQLTANVVDKMGKVREKAKHLNLSNDEIIATVAQEMNEESENLEKENSELRKALDRSEYSRAENFKLAVHGAEIIGDIAEKLHHFKEQQEVDTLTWHKNYRKQLADEREENLNLRNQINDMKAAACRANESLRQMRRFITDNDKWTELEIENHRLRTEKRFWKRCALPLIPDDDSEWSDDDDLIDPEEKKREEAKKEKDRQSKEDSEDQLP